MRCGEQRDEDVAQVTKLLHARQRVTGVPSIRPLASAVTPSTTNAVPFLSTLILTCLATTGVASAQTPEAIRELGLLPTLGIRFGVALLLNLLFAGLLVGFAPHFTKARVHELRDDPGEGFVWGLIAGIGVPLLLVVLAITIIGLLITIPGLLVLALFGLAGQGVVVSWVGTLVTDGTEPTDGMTILVGAVVLAGVSAVPLLGNFAYRILLLFGLGVVFKTFYEDYRR